MSQNLETISATEEENKRMKLADNVEAEEKVEVEEKTQEEEKNVDVTTTTEEVVDSVKYKMDNPLLFLSLISELNLKLQGVYDLDDDFIHQYSDIALKFWSLFSEHHRVRYDSMGSETLKASVKDILEGFKGKHSDLDAMLEKLKV